MSLTGSTSRHCYAVGCSNGDYRLRKWRDSICETHGGLKEKCSCPPPFELFAFPTKRKDNNKRQRWICLLKRASSSNSFKYQDPSKDQRLCSDHFIDGRPTERNPNPVLKLGHSPKRPIETSRREARYAKRACKSNERTYTAKLLTVNDDNSKARYIKRSCKSDEETYTAQLVTDTDDNSSRSTDHSTSYSLPVLKVAIHFIINIFLCLIRKYKNHIKQLEKENMLLKVEINILKQRQSSSARTKPISWIQCDGACSQKTKLSTEKSK